MARYGFDMLFLMLAAVEVLSFNVRYDNSSDAHNSWSARRSSVQDYLIQSRADFIGLQEVLPQQFQQLREGLTEYEVLYRTRDSDSGQGEGTPLWYRSDRWKPDPSLQGTFWLSEQPEKAGSKSWDASLPRICTWARFIRIGDGEPQAIWIWNTHFDHRGKASRLRSARLIRQKIEQRPSAFTVEPVVVLGDLNTTPGTPPLLALGLADAHASSTSGTWNGWDSAQKKGRRIDYILSRGLDAISSKVDFPLTPKGTPVSDHWPVRSVLQTPRRPF